MLALFPLPLPSSLCFGHFVCFHGSGFSQVFEFQQATFSNLLTYVSPYSVKNFAVIYLVDITEVPDFNKMYELYDPCTVMFFFRNKHIMIDLGTGNNNKINWTMEDKQEMIDIIETVYRGARKGRGLVVSPKDYSTKYRY
uniref:Uncharacterized protein n=1 Tax=Oreochromis aureus TaxID=47969 RepID=A0A668S0C6_OREAU